jgi:hypothetical protein
VIRADQELAQTQQPLDASRRENGRVRSVPHTVTGESST